MKELTDAITERQAQIKQLQSHIETLQRAASILGGKGTTATAKPKAKRKAKRRMSAAARKALSKKLKAYWANRKK